MNSNGNSNPVQHEFKPGQYLTTRQAARFLDLSPGTLQNWRCSGAGPKFTRHRRSVYYLFEDIQEYIDQNFRKYGSTYEYKLEASSKTKG